MAPAPRRRRARAPLLAAAALCAGIAGYVVVQRALDTGAATRQLCVKVRLCDAVFATRGGRLPPARACCGARAD